jgi:hypothetical protein
MLKLNLKLSPEYTLNPKLHLLLPWQIEMIYEFLEKPECLLYKKLPNILYLKKPGSQN